ncbi:MAG: hypothetical protein ACYSWW_25095 [Planctomycetota bacterium]
MDFDALSERQCKGIDPVLSNFICPDVARMYRVFNFALDTRARILNNDAIKNSHESIIKGLKDEWGEFEFPKKLKRFKGLDLSFLGIPEEYYNLLWDVVSSYCCGRFYPAMTSAGALGERILNRLIIKTRDYHKTSPHYKKIYRKSSFDQWGKPISILKEWGVISPDVAKSFNRLKKFRNDSIHYSDGYEFETNSHDAVAALAEIIDGQFNYEKRQDLFWVFHVPGEILLKSEKVDEPFVKEFVLPHCALITPYCEPTADPPVRGRNTPLKPLSDEEFMRLRKTKDAKSHPDTKTES